MVSRRQALKLVGGTAVGLSATAGVTAAARNENANGRRPTTRVAPFEDQQVPVGNAIEHSVGWVEHCGGETERLARLDEFLEVVELDVHIEGVDVGDTTQYWGDPYVDGDEVYVWWRLVTGPRPPGVYDFDLMMRFTEPYESRYETEDGCVSNVREGVVFDRETVYEVTPDAGAGRSGTNGRGGES